MYLYHLLGGDWNMAGFYDFPNSNNSWDDDPMFFSMDWIKGKFTGKPHI